MEKKYGKAGARRRIYTVTDPKESSSLKKLAIAEGYKTFDHPLDVGGRFSVLTVVGLLPIAAAGFDVDAMLQGAADAYQEYLSPSIEKNIAYQYAAVMNILYRKNIRLGQLYCRPPGIGWWKQLLGKEGKDGKGIFCSVNFTTDLYSMGQYMQYIRIYLKP